MTTNSQLLTTTPKTKTKTKTKTNQAINQNRNRTTEMEITWRVIRGGGERGENGEKGTGNKKHKCQVQNRQGRVKNSIGNGEAIELVCMTHGQELRGGMWVGWVVQGRGE